MREKELIKLIYSIATNAYDRILKDDENIYHADDLVAKIETILQDRMRERALSNDERSIHDAIIQMLRNQKVREGIEYRLNSIEHNISNKADKKKARALLAHRVICGEISLLDEIGTSHPSLADDGVRGGFTRRMYPNEMWRLMWSRWCDLTGSR